MPHHEGVEERPTGPYFTMRHEMVSQGDIFEDVPVVRRPASLAVPAEITSAEAMVLTASCQIDRRTHELLIAPVVPLNDLGLSPGDMNEIVELDCRHRLMYLPAESGRVERAVRIDRAQLIGREVLEAFDRQSQLTLDATRQLMRKVTLWYTGNHFPRVTFIVPPDDF